MQKKIIALAIAGLASTAAFAQSNVTVYGLIDLGYTHLSGSDTKATKSRSGIDSGNMSGSRIGFRGTEDLGNGLKASFVLEQAISADTGAATGYTRQSFVALSNNLGTVAAGRMYTPQYNLLSKIDPFAGTGVAAATGASSVYSMASHAAAGADGEIRLSNLVAYVSPNFGGFTVTAGYTANGLANEETTDRGNKSNDAKVWAISPVYANGPLMVGANYHRVTIDAFGAEAATASRVVCTTVTAGAATGCTLVPAVAAVLGNKATNSVFDIGGTYDFGMVKLGAAYGQSKVDISTVQGEAKETKWLLSASAPIGANGMLLATYSRVKSEDDLGGVANPDGKARKYSIGYVHNLSKRTNVYAAYGALSTNNEAEGDYNIGGTVGDDFTKGYTMGIRHSF